MGWEKRDRGTSYYYRGHRIGHRVIKVYVGRGPAAEAAAQADAEHRAARARRHQAEQQRRLAYEAIGAQVAECCTEAAGLMDAALLIDGYYRHDRGAWRRRRHGKSEEGEAM